MNLKESLFNHKAKVEAVEVEGVTYYCRDYGAYGRDIYERFLIDRQDEAQEKAKANGATIEEAKKAKLDTAGIRAMMLICGLCDADGKPILTTDDYDAVCKLPGAVVAPLFNKIADLNAVSEADIEELKNE